MVKVKNVPLTIRIDSDLHEILTKRATELGKTTNGYIREKLYEMGSFEAVPVTKYEEIQDLVENSKKKIKDDLSSFHSSIGLLRFETSELKTDIRSIEKADLIFSKAMKNIDSTALTVDEKLKKSLFDISQYTNHLNDLMNNAEKRIGLSVSKVLNEYESEEMKESLNKKLKLKSAISTASLILFGLSCITMIFSLVSVYLIYGK